MKYELAIRKSGVHSYQFPVMNTSIYWKQLSQSYVFVVHKLTNISFMKV